MGPSNNYDYDTNEPTVDGRPSHKKLFIIIGIIIGLLLIAVTAALLFTNLSVTEEKNTGLDPKTRINREGYANVPDHIGDPFALAQLETATPISYRKAPVIDACHMLPLETIKDQKLFIASGSDSGAMSRNYFDGSGDAAETEWHTSENLVREINDCSYGLLDKTGKRGDSLYIQVFEPTYAGDLPVRQALDDYLRRGEVTGGVRIYDRVNTPITDSRTFHFLQKDNTYIGVEFNVSEDGREEKVQALLQSIAGRLAGAPTQPRGPAQYGYDSPTFDGDYKSACSITSAIDIKTLFNKPASPSLQERIATSTGIISHGDEKSNYVVNQCVRRTSDERAKASTLNVETRSFENEAASKAFLVSHRSESTIASKTKIGDETFYNPSGDKGQTLFFRTGETVIMLWMYEPDGEAVTDAKRLERLTPIAATIHTRIVGEKPQPEKVEEKPVEQVPTSQAQPTPTAPQSTAPVPVQPQPSRPSGPFIPID